MYANLLLDEEKVVFLKLLTYLSKIDKNISENEVVFIERIAQDIGVVIDKNFFDLEVQDLKELLSSFKNEQSKNILLTELINLAFSDDNYSHDERKGILEISRLLDVSESKLSEIENWIIEGNTWLYKGSKLILV
ncbi:hypothetical protein [uncultured Ilyobacter sp.]|uniref:hypothetical protein n=1 Tax=uncultured Ilyobacter sp. TaxID=544433 RepID=UPI002AA75623|nr:hypothetical protein [uncultured Ilyobacter sp.]